MRGGTSVLTIKVATSVPPLFYGELKLSVIDKPSRTPPISQR
jgi:hypothetical protein